MEALAPNELGFVDLLVNGLDEVDELENVDGPEDLVALVGILKKEEAFMDRFALKKKPFECI